MQLILNIIIRSKNIRTTTTSTEEKSRSKKNKFNWKEEQNFASNKIKNKIHHIIENEQFDTTNQKRVKCDANSKEMGASIE